MKVLIRPYSYSDEGQVQSLLKAATYSTINRLFLAMLQREIFIQIALMSSAVAFVVVGVRLEHCFVTFPLTALFFYFACALGHVVKAHAFHPDLKNIEGTYLSNPRTGFWVAELIEGSPADSQVEFTSSEDLNTATSGREIVGTVAVTIKADPDKREPPESVAWLRRMAVKAGYQRKGIGDALVETTIKHCVNKRFRAIELLTTEFHRSAKNLYVKKGFEIMNSYPKGLVLGFISIGMYRFRMPCVSTRSVMDI